MKDCKMRIMTSISDTEELLEFVKKAANHFTENEKHSTFGDLTPGSYLAIRWGLDDDCVLVLKVDENSQVVVFQQAIQRNNVLLHF